MLLAKKIAIFSLFISVLCFSKTTYAACSATLTQLTSWDFTTYAKPASGNETAIISTSGTLSGTGTQLYGTPTVATFLFKKTGGTCTSNTINITRSNIVQPSGVTLSALKVLVNGVTYTSFPTGVFDAGADVTNGNGILITLGGTAVISSSVALGDADSSADLSVIWTNP